MRAWITSHRYALVSAWNGLRREPWVWLSSALAIATAVLLPSLLFSLVQLVSPGLKQLATDPEISVFMKSEAKTEELIRARSVIEQQLKSLGSIGNSASVTSVSKAQALEQLRAQLARVGGNSNALAVLEENPLPDAFLIRLPGFSVQVVNHLAQSLRTAIPQADLIQVDSAWIQTLAQLVFVVQVLLGLAAVLFAIVVMAITFHTTRSQVLQLRDEVEVAALLGASAAFIRRPFFYRGALLGALGGVFALLLALALLTALAYGLMPVSNTTSSTLLNHAFSTERWLEGAVVLMLSCIMGAAGGGWAAQRQLWSLTAR